MCDIPIVTYEEVVESLLHDWGFSELISDFKAFGVSFEVLKTISDDDIRELIPREKMGLRVRFKNKLYEWRLANGFSFNVSTAETLSVDSSVRSWIAQTEGIIASPNSPTSTSGNHASLSLGSIIKQTLNGKALLNEYENTQSLSFTSRGVLSGLIVDSWLSEKRVVNTSTFLDAVKEIKELFPSEDTETFYVPRNGNIYARGKLVDKYYARRKKYQKLGLLNSRYVKKSKLNVEKNTKEISVLQEEVENDMEQAYLWLQHNFEPLNLVTEKWEKSYNRRRRDILTNAKSILDLWPSLKIPHGHIFIELDFEKLHPGKDVNLFSRWYDFNSKIRTIFKNNVKDPSSKFLLQTLEQGNLSEDSTDFIICLLLSTLLVPKIVNYKKEEKRISFKPSILDGQNAFAMRVNTYNDVKPALERQKSKLFELGATFQPCIIVVGNKVETVNEFYCYFNDVFYKVNSFLKAVSVVFKLHQVLNLRYAYECVSVWHFFERYFFDIKVSGNISSSLAGLLSDLKN